MKALLLPSVTTGLLPQLSAYNSSSHCEICLFIIRESIIVGVARESTVLVKSNRRKSKTVHTMIMLFFKISPQGCLRGWGDLALCMLLGNILYSLDYMALNRFPSRCGTTIIKCCKPLGSVFKRPNS